MIRTTPRALIQAIQTTEQQHNSIRNNSLSTGSCGANNRAATEQCLEPTPRTLTQVARTTELQPNSVQNNSWITDSGDANARTATEQCLEQLPEHWFRQPKQPNGNRTVFGTIPRALIRATHTTERQQNSVQNNSQNTDSCGPNNCNRTECLEQLLEN